MPDIIVTTPKSEMAASAQEAKDCILAGGGEYFRRFARRPNLRLGDRIYYVEDGYIRGFALVQRVEAHEAMNCATTGRDWAPGWYAFMPADTWKWIAPIPMKGFQGYRRASFQFDREEVRILGGWLDPKPKSGKEDVMPRKRKTPAGAPTGPDCDGGCSTCSATDCERRTEPAQGDRVIEDDPGKDVCEGCGKEADSLITLKYGRHSTAKLCPKCFKERSKQSASDVQGVAEKAVHGALAEVTPEEHLAKIMQQRKVCYETGRLYEDAKDRMKAAKEAHDAAVTDLMMAIDGDGPLPLFDRETGEVLEEGTETPPDA